MRALVVSVLTSLDGYYEGPGGDLSAIPFEDAFNSHNLGLLEAADTMVYGSTWFADNLAHWSAVAADPDANDRDRRIAEIVTTIDNVVISDTLAIDPDAPWAAHTTVVPRAGAAAEIARLKHGDGGSLLMFGSATTWNPLLGAGLVDELIVLVGAALVGGGSKIYDGPRAALELIGTRVLPGSQLVELRYGTAPERDRPKT